MTVAFVNQPFAVLFPGEAGDSIGIWTSEVARLLARSRPVVVYSRRHPSQAATETRDGIEHRRLSVRLDRLLRPLRLLDQWGIASPTRPVFASGLYYPQFGSGVAMDLRSRPCDIVHIHNFSQYVTAIRALNPRIRIVLHMHGEWLSALDRTMIERRLRKVDVVLTCSDYCTNQARERFPGLATRCRTLYNGADVDLFVPRVRPAADAGPRVKRLLFVGVVSPHKGVHVLLDAFREVVARYPDVHLDIVGGYQRLSKSFLVPTRPDPMMATLDEFYRGNYLEHLRARMTPAVASRVTFAGHVPHAQTRRYYQKADIVVLPSVCHEAFPIPAAEAMAAGVPLVCTRSGGLVEAVEDGRTGLVVERGDAEALADAILRLLTDEPRRQAMGRVSRERAVARFSWERITASLESLYDRDLAARPSGQDG